MTSIIALLYRAGMPLIGHHVEALAKVKGLKHILLLGFYPPQLLQQFIDQMSQQDPGNYC